MLERLSKTIRPWALGLLALSLALPVQAERIKDLASIEGMRGNQLMGYGIVVGLDGTGDSSSQAPFTLQSIRNMLERYGVTLPPGNMQLKNVAAVSVTAELPPFARPGQKIDVTVASMGNAKSLRGGSLIMTPLRGADGKIYAMAQGNLVVGGFGAQAKDGSRISVNVPSAGRIPLGATVEREVPTDIAANGTIHLTLNTPDFTTAKRISDAINKALGGGVAEALDAVSVRVAAPATPDQQVSFLSYLENLDVTPAEPPARVIVNSRTGTVVIGSNVRVSPAAVTHGSLTVAIKEGAQVSQPAPLSGGQTTVTPASEVNVQQEKKPMFLFAPGVTLQEIVQAVNQVGAAPGDLVAILEALKAAGALKAELIII
ncbi:MAG: flagellar basal body P-ring protein FlgI [Halothiobacillaceae bacterium]